MPLSPRDELCPTMLIPKKFTVSIFSVTVITSNDIELSVMLLKDEALEGCRNRRRFRRLRYAGA